MRLDGRFWEKYLRVYDCLNEIDPYRDLLAQLCEALEITGGDEILDAGCGTGNLSMKLHTQGARVTGIDSEPTCLDYCRRKAIPGRFLVGSLTKELPFPDEYFDKIVSNNVIYTIDPAARPGVFEEFYRVLRPDGKIVISNVREGWRPFAVYRAHLQGVKARQGGLRTLWLILRFALPTARMFYYNALIQREGHGGRYGFMKPGEQQALLRQAGFSRISDDRPVYAGQGILNVACKVQGERQGRGREGIKW